MIWYTVAYNSNKNIGEYYNAFVNIIPSDDDYACFIDADTIFTTSDYGSVIESVVERYPDVDCFTCYTNRVNCDWQVPDGCDDRNDDYKYHRDFGTKLKEKYGNECCDMTNGQLFSGMFFLIKKSAWKKIGGALPTGMLRVDNDIHQKLRDNGLKLYLMKGLYVYHWHRGSRKNNSVAHLNNNDVIKPVKKKISTNKSNIIIYTCITGGYDIPRDYFPHKEGYEYILVSDKPVKTNSWKNIVYDFSSLGDMSDVKKQRYIKTHADVLFPNNEMSIWIDGNIPITDKIYEYYEKYKNFKITFKKHNQRDCIFEEIKTATYIAHKDSKEMGKYLIKRYDDEGMPRHKGLYETNIIIRHHNNKDVKILMDKWWKEIKLYSHRDQFSLTYCIWKLGCEEKITTAVTKDFPPMGHKYKR